MNCVELGVPLEIVLKYILLSIFIRNHGKKYNNKRLVKFANDMKSENNMNETT